MAQAKATVFNPDTKERKVVEVGSPEAFAGGFQLEKSFDPATGISVAAEQPASTPTPLPDITPTATPSVLPTADQVSTGSEAITQERGDFETSVNKLTEQLSGDQGLLKGLTESKAFTQTEQGKQDLQNIRTISQSVRDFTTGELSQIKEAGAAVGAEFDVLIRAADDAKKQGLPKAIIGAGERGGFLNTQFAGVAALAPIADESFLGAGGELERISSVFDRNIQDLQSRRIQAVNAAESAARQAITTGKQTDLDNVKVLFDLAKAAHDDEVKLGFEKVEAITNLEKIARGIKERREDIKREEEKFQKEFGFNKEQQAINNALNIAGLTGDFEGEPTIAAQRLIAEQAFNEAKITGLFDGEPTLAKLSFEEAIRSNKVQELLQARSVAIQESKLAGAGGDGGPEEVSSLSELVANGSLSTKEALGQVSKENRQALLTELVTTPLESDTENDVTNKEKANLSLDLKTHDGLNSSVGPTKLQRIALKDIGGAKSDFIAGVEQLVSGLSLEELIEAKARGATFGALSDSEMKILSSAATRIGTWRQKDENGNVTGYKASEKSFKDELDNINKIITRNIKSSIEKQDTVSSEDQELIDAGFSPEQIEEIKQAE